MMKPVLTGSVRSSPLRLAVVRAAENRGPAGGRNLGLQHTRGQLVAFTDDDCVPTPGWLDALREAAFGGADIVQGATRPRPADPRTSAWDRTVEITDRTGLFETCNIAYRSEVLDRTGGFDDSGAVVGHRAARPFGEDADLGWRAERQGARFAFEPRALVHHRWLPGTYRGWLAERRQLGNFAALARRVPGFRDLLFARWFLTPASAAFDLALVATSASVATRHPLVLLGTLPWMVLRWPDARARPGRHPFVRLTQLAVGDVVGFVSLAEGSLRHRRLVL